MYRPKNDPFFEDLKAEIQEGMDEANRGELIDEDQVWKSLDATIRMVKERRKTEPGLP
jgi:predicted transcriptional regulator